MKNWENLAFFILFYFFFCTKIHLAGTNWIPPTEAIPVDPKKDKFCYSFKSK